jgi:hypothetical protein
MFVHIVFWRLLDIGENGLTKVENGLEIRRRFEALRGRIPGMRRCEVGVNVDPSPDAADLVLYTEFDSAEAFAGYPPHPLHREIVAFLKGVRTERRVVDYERP